MNFSDSVTVAAKRNVGTVSGDDLPELNSRPRSREDLAIDIGLYALTNGVDEIPIDFFRCQEEIDIAESLTEEETLRAAAVVMEVFAEQTPKLKIQRAAYRLSAVLHTRANAYARAPGCLRVCVRRPRDRRPRTHRVRARAGASRDGPSGSDDPPGHKPPPHVVPLARLRWAVRGWLEAVGHR